MLELGRGLRGYPAIKVTSENSGGATTKPDATKLAPIEKLVKEGSRDTDVLGCEFDAEHCGRSARDQS